ncbi:MAG: DNA polymerase III subunit delta [Lachnospiraceae bacterium]|nr:DNA polymerase III subunit delta [Lachnospiraceae bacterium]
MKRLASDIKNKSFLPVYLLYGDEDYLVSQYKNRLFQAASDGDTMNTMSVAGKDTDLMKLRDFTDTLPFFADRRVVLLEDTGLFKQASEGYDGWIEKLPPTACVIFSEKEVDKRTRLYKAVQNKGYIAELNHPDERMISDWVLKKIGQRKLSVTKDAFRRFFEICDPEMQTMENELQKLLDYCSEKGTIETSDVDLVVTKSLQNRVFDLIDRVSSGKRVESLDLYYDLLALKEAPMRILYLITRQLNQMMLVLRMQREGRSRDQMAAVLKLRPFIAGKILQEASRYSIASLEGFLKEALDLESAVKSGDLQENMSVEMLIFRMTA